MDEEPKDGLSLLMWAENQEQSSGFLMPRYLRKYAALNELPSDIRVWNKSQVAFVYRECRNRLGRLDYTFVKTTQMPSF